MMSKKGAQAMYVGKKRIIAYLISACGITWFFWVIQSFLGITEGSAVYLFIAPSVLGPAIAALIILYKKVPLRDYVKHCFTFEQKLSYYVIFAAFIVWRFILMMAVGGRIEGSTLYLPLILLPICLFTGGNEEFGWRGFLQPQMEKKMHAVPVAFIFTAYWTIWHLPLFFLPIDPRSPFEILFLLGFFMTNAFTIAALYKTTKSVLFCVFFHAWANALTNSFSLGPDWKVIAGFLFEWLVAMIILIMCERGQKRNKKEAG